VEKGARDRFGSGQSLISHGGPPLPDYNIGFSITYLEFIISVLCILVKSFLKTDCKFAEIVV